MSSSPERRHGEKRGGKLVPALCNIFGILILLSVIGLYLPITLARLFQPVHEIVSALRKTTDTVLRRQTGNRQ